MPPRTAQGMEGSQSAKPTAPAKPSAQTAAGPAAGSAAAPLPCAAEFVERHDDPEQAEELERQQDA